MTAAKPHPCTALRPHYLGGVNQIITQYPGERFGDWYPETFDIVLLVPAAWRTCAPPTTVLHETSSSERHRLQERQVQLKSALS